MDVTEDNIVTIGTFIEYLTYYIKMGIYINKGTDNNALLERCIKLYNRYKQLEASDKISNSDEISVRKCLKRLNLVLKVDSELNPIDIQIRSNQSKIISLNPHPSFESDNLKEMIESATKHQIDIFTNIPLTFMLRPSKHQQLLWLYTKVLFYVSQLILSKPSANADQTDPAVQLKCKVYGESLERFSSVLEQIESFEEAAKVNKLMALDNFLNNKLIKTGINEESIATAKNEVKEIFQRKGLTNNPAMNKMIDTISDKLTNFDASDGNLVQNMISMAQTVAEEMRPELENNPEAFQNTLGSITEIFQDMMNNSGGIDGVEGEMPAEFKNIMGIVKSMTDMNPTDENSMSGMDDIMSELERMVSSNGLDRESFFRSIGTDTGDIDLDKLQSFLSKS